MNAGSLFSGYGGLDLAIKAVFGARTLWHSEIDPAASRVLAARWPGVPNLGDIAAIDWTTVPQVDVLTGGFPCQDVSHAGKRAGLRPDTRSGLWSQMAYAIDQLRPTYVVAENVRGLLSAKAESAPNAQQCICGGTARRRGLDRPGDQQGLLPRQSDGRDDPASTPDARHVGRALGWIGRDDQSSDREVGRGVGLDGGGKAGECAAGGSPAASTDQGQTGRARDRSGEVATRVAPQTEWQRGVEFGHAYAVCTDQDGIAPAEQEGPATCAACGGATTSGIEASSDLEPCSWCLGDTSGESALRALGAVLGDLADLGYDAWWCGLRAADVGAPHGRFRVFILAVDSDAAGERRWPEGRDDGLRSAGLVADAAAHPGDRARATADTDQQGPQGTQPAGRRHLPDGGTAADTNSDGLALIRREHTEQRDADRRRGPDIAWGPYEPAIRRWEHATGRVAPAPTETGPKGAQRLSPRFVEWMMGLPAGWVTDIPDTTRNDQLKMLGNGVVPQQAEAALRYLVSAADHAGVAA